MEVSAGVVVREGERVKRGPKQVLTSLKISLDVCFIQYFYDVLSVYLHLEVEVHSFYVYSCPWRAGVFLLCQNVIGCLVVYQTQT